MFCPKCGIQLPNNAKFCAKCGAQLKAVDNSLASVSTKPAVDVSSDEILAAEIARAKAEAARALAEAQAAQARAETEAARAIAEAEAAKRLAESEAAKARAQAAIAAARAEAETKLVNAVGTVTSASSSVATKASKAAGELMSKGVEGAKTLAKKSAETIGESKVGDFINDAENKEKAKNFFFLLRDKNYNNCVRGLMLIPAVGEWVRGKTASLSSDLKRNIALAATVFCVCFVIFKLIPTSAVTADDGASMAVAEGTRESSSPNLSGYYGSWEYVHIVQPTRYGELAHPGGTVKVTITGTTLKVVSTIRDNAVMSHQNLNVSVPLKVEGNRIPFGRFYLEMRGGDLILQPFGFKMRKR